MPKKIDFDPNYEVPDANTQVAAAMPDADAVLVKTVNGLAGATSSDYEATPGEKVCGLVLRLSGDYLTDAEVATAVAAFLGAVPGKISGLKIFGRLQVPRDVPGKTQRAHCTMRTRYDDIA